MNEKPGPFVLTWCHEVKSNWKISALCFAVEASIFFLSSILWYMWVQILRHKEDQHREAIRDSILQKLPTVFHSQVLD
jgi:hypothetical protein